MTNRGEGDKRRRDDLIDYTLVIAAYGVGMLDDFNPFVLLLASIWALRIGLFERRGLRLTKRGDSWWPSKNPDDYE